MEKVASRGDNSEFLPGGPGRGSAGRRAALRAPSPRHA